MPERRLSFKKVSSIKPVREGAATADVAITAMHTAASRKAVARCITLAAALPFVNPYAAEMAVEERE